MSFLWGCTGFDKYRDIYMQWIGRPKLPKLKIIGNEYNIVDPAIMAADQSASTAIFA